jgi:hypothetical protein
MRHYSYQTTDIQNGLHRRSEEIAQKETTNVPIRHTGRDYRILIVKSMGYLTMSGVTTQRKPMCDMPLSYAEP